MAIIRQIKTPTNNTYDIHASGIPYAQVDDTSTATDFTATVPGITSLEDGTCVLLKNGQVTSASGFTININGLGDKPCYSNLTTGHDTTAPTRDTTIFNINYTMLFIYSSDIVDGGGWICYRGYDSNSNTIGYQLRTNSGNLEASDTSQRYRLWFTSVDGKKWVPANTSSATDASTSRTMNTRPINPFGPIVYNSTNGSVSSGARPAVTTLWQQYTLTIGYSYVVSLTAWDPVYVQCTPQTDGSAVMNAIVKALPTSNDGKIYIYLGMAYSTSSMELRTEHPVFYHDGNGIKLWTGTKIPSKTSDLTNDGNFVVDASYVHTDNNYTTTEKNKLANIAAGAEVNQNAFSNVKVGSTTVAADGKTDTLELVAGSNITLTPDATNDKVTIAATDNNTTYDTFSTSVNGLVPKPASAATNSYLNSSGTWTTPPNTTYSTATTAANGLMSSADKTLLTSLQNNSITDMDYDGQDESNGYKIIVQTDSLNDPIEEIMIPQASTATHGVVKPDGTASHYLNGTGGWTTPPNTTYGTVTTAANGLMSSTDKKKLDAMSTVDNNSTYSLTQNSSDGHKLIWTANGGTPATFTIPDNNTTYADVTTSAHGLMTAADKIKLNAMSTVDNNSTYGLSQLSDGHKLVWTGTGVTATTFTIPDNNTTYDLSTIAGTLSVAKGGTGATNAASARTNLQAASTAVATTAANGLMSAADKVKLNALSTVSQSGTLSGTTGTDNYKVVLSKTASTATIPAASTSAAGVMTTAQVSKLNGVEAGANNYTHPSYTAATGAPTSNQSPGFGGTFSVNQVDRDSAGHIGSLTSRTITIPSAVVTTAANGLMSSTDKKKLDAMSTVDNNTTYTLTISTAANSTAHLVSGSSTIANITIPNTTNTTYGTVTSAEAGLAPAGGSGTTKYLRQDGSWQVPPDNNATYTLTGTTSTSDYKVVLSGANAATATIPLATSARAGLVKPNGSSGYCLNGTGGWSAFNYYTHPTFATEAGVPTANQTPSFGGTFSVNQVSRDSNGHVSAVTSRTITIPNSTFTTSANGLVPHPSAASTVSLLNSSGTWTELPIKSDGGSVSGNITLAGPAASNSPSLIFQRGTFTDNYNDWQIQDRGGFLYFDQRGSGSSNFSNQVVFNTSGNVSAVSFSGSGASLTNLNASNLSTGTVPVARLPLATTAAVGAIKPDGTTITVDSNGVISASSGGGSGSTPLTGDTTTVTPNNVKDALDTGRDVYLTHNTDIDMGYATPVNFDFYFTSWNVAEDTTMQGQVISVVASQTLIKYSGDWFAFSLKGNLNNDAWQLSFTKITELFNVKDSYSGNSGVVINNVIDNNVGDYSVAEGNMTSALGQSSHAEGQYTYANGTASHAEGNGSSASGNYSHAEGSNTTATGAQSHAEGYQTLASTASAHAEGDHTTASGTQSHAEGYRTLASGASAHAEGDATTASGYASHAQGTGNIASGDQAFVNGYQSTVSHRNSIAVGMNVRTSHNEQAVFGAFNADDSTALLLVGNGASTASADRKNALAVHTDGRVSAGANATASEDLVRLGQILDFQVNELSGDVTCSNGSWCTPTSVQLNSTGLYLVSAHVDFASSSAGRRAIILTSTSSGTTGNTINHQCIDVRAAVNGDRTTSSIVTVLNVTHTDYKIYCRAWQNSGSAKNVTGSLKIVKLK